MDNAASEYQPTRRRPAVNDVTTKFDDGSSIAVLLVIDAPLLRDGLVHVLAAAPLISVVGTAGTRAEALAALDLLRPSVVLLDMSTAECMEISRALRAEASAVSIVAFSVDLSDDDQLLCVEAGITGFVPRHGGVRELVDAVVGVARGDAVCTPHAVGATFRRLAELAANRGNVTDGTTLQLSARELQIVGLIDAGLSNKEIAHQLDIGVATVKNHVHHILEKLQVSTRGEAAAHLRQSAARRPSHASRRAELQDRRSASEVRR